MLSSSLRTNHDKKKIGEGEGEKEHVRFPSVDVPPGGCYWLLVVSSYLSINVWLLLWKLLLDNLAVIIFVLGSDLF